MPAVAAEASPFVLRSDYDATMTEVKSRLSAVEAAQRLGDEQLKEQLTAVSGEVAETKGAVLRIEGATSAQTKTLVAQINDSISAQTKILERFATREELAELATKDALIELHVSLAAKDTAHEERFTKLAASVRALRAKMATRWQAYAQIAGILAAIAAGIAGAVAR